LLVYWCIRKYWLSTLIKNQGKVALEMSFAKLWLWDTYLSVAETNRAPTYLRARSILSTLSENHLIPGSFAIQGRCTSVMIGTVSVTVAFPSSSRCSEEFLWPSFYGNREVFTIAQISASFAISCPVSLYTHYVFKRDAFFLIFTS